MLKAHVIYYSRNWTWLYLVSVLAIAVFTWQIDRQIEINQLDLPVDYN